MFDTSNPLRTEQLTPLQLQEINRIKKLIANHEIPYKYPDYLLNHIYSSVRERDWFIEHMGFALLSNNWIEPLAEYLNGSICLEIMGGSGALTRSLLKAGNRLKLDFHIICSDDFSWDGMANWNTAKNYWKHIDNKDCIDAIKEFGLQWKDLNYIICSWPYMDSKAYESLITMRECYPDAKFIYIGEGPGGCTADDKFFDTAIEVYDDAFSKAVEDFQSWFGIHDRVILYK